MTDKSLAAVLPEPNAPLEIQELKIPEVIDGAVLMKVSNVGVCGTDVHLWHGKLSGVPYPLILGHEVVGTVERVGPGDTRDLNGHEIVEGDRIAFHDVVDTCYSCWYCLIAKAPTKCPHRSVYGITLDSTKWPYLIGGYSEYLYLKPRTQMIKIPEHVTFDDAIFAGCALPTAIHAVTRSPLRWGTNVAVQGAGPVGLMLTILAKINGANTITTIDRSIERLKFAEEFGATHTLNIEETSLDERRDLVRDISEGHGPDIVYEATGNALAVPEGIELVREGGTYTICGQYTDSGGVEVNPHYMNRKHLDIRTVWGTETTHVYQAVRTIADNVDRFPLRKLVTHHFMLDEAQKALETQGSQKSLKAVIQPNE
ncbi:MAG: zinc-binding dehydrogenase [Candidatus Thorarchaeota archaeon]|nr:MAG: zinc-binding dehydrogenase [Candidatus Thorarchaeota archaeon]